MLNGWKTKEDEEEEETGGEGGNSRLKRLSEVSLNWHPIESLLGD